MNDKETELQVSQDRIETIQRMNQDLEAKSQSLQLTIDRLTLALAKSEEEESSSKDKVCRSDNLLNISRGLSIQPDAIFTNFDCAL